MLRKLHFILFQENPKEISKQSQNNSGWKGPLDMTSSTKQGLSSWVLNVFKGGDFTTFLYDLFQFFCCCNELLPFTYLKLSWLQLCSVAS